MKTTRSKFLICTVICLLMSGYSPGSRHALAHEDPGPASLKPATGATEEDGEPSPERFQRKKITGHYLIEYGDKPVLIHSYRRGVSHELALPRGRVIKLPLQLPVLLSRNTKTVLQYGDSLSRMHPVRTNLYWVGLSGNIIHQVQNRYKGRALVDMAIDGTVAAAGEDFFASHAGKDADRPLKAAENAGVHLDLYHPEGKRLWSLMLRPETKVLQVRALPGGKKVIVQTSSAKNLLEDHRLQLFTSKGGGPKFGAEFGIIQKIVTLDNSTMAFIQGSQGHGMVDLQRGRTLWHKKERIRLISPKAAVLGSDETELLLMTGTRKDRTQPLYTWKLWILDALSGRKKGEKVLKKPYPSSWGPVFLDLSPTVITILADNEKVKIRLRQIN